ncbi:MAG TPA: PHP domain-containing protein [Candidatus Nanoarchaeia archaeon]|nr:PHP domain-containing protein [Candidatus Nanoarchaeia archaeon]
MKIDLHMHTTASDGLLKPAELVELAVSKKLAAIAITDHDTIDGISEAVSAAGGRIEIIPGCEISCDDPGFVDIHVLGLFLDIHDQGLRKLLAKAKEERINQKKQMIKKLNSLGLKITFEEVQAIASGEVGRPHLARIVLKNNPEKITSIQQVFDEYLGTGKKAYVERKSKISIKQAVDAIHAAQGLALLCHPGVYMKGMDIKLINYFISAGGDGIETYYPYHKNCKGVTQKESDEKRIQYLAIAARKKCLASGGSDFHGNQRADMGEEFIDYEVLTKLKEARGEQDGVA